MGLIRSIMIHTILICLIISSATLFCPAEVGLVGYWGFDEGKGNVVNDLSGLGNNGIIKGKVHWVEGKSGMALAFFKPEAIYVDIADSKSLDISEQITISAWIKPSDIYIGGDWRERNCIIAKRRAYYLDISEKGYLSSYLYNVLPEEWLVGITDMTRFLNKWVPVAVVYNGKEHSLYVNGRLDASVKKSGNITVDEERLTIGWVDNNRLFNGVIDEVKIWFLGLKEDALTKALLVEAKYKLAICWGMLK